MLVHRLFNLCSLVGDEKTCHEKYQENRYGQQLVHAVVRLQVLLALVCCIFIIKIFMYKKGLLKAVKTVCISELFVIMATKKK